MPGWKHPVIFIFVISVRIIYTLHGKNIVHLTHGSSDWMHFFYDASGKVASVNYNGQRYAYLYNMQGDVMGLLDSSGTEVVKYVYDAWGRQLSKTGTLATTLGTLNPFRYRGYIYDEETGLYYLRSRYYNPTWGRFVNADSVLGFAASLKNRNAFAYCDSAPVLYCDNNGTWGENTSQMPASYLLDLLYGMLEDCLDPKKVWKYAPGQRERRVDCIGMIAYCAEQYMTKRAFGPAGYNVKKGTRLANEYNRVEAAFGILPSMDTSGSDTTLGLYPGTILYYEANNHVGVYVGRFNAPDGTYYVNGVIHCSSKNGRVMIEELEDTRFVKYCTFNYIHYDLPTDYEYHRWQVLYE